MTDGNGKVTDVRAADLFRVLADATRFGIVRRLSEKGAVDDQASMSVGELCEAMDKPQPTVSHHLSLLRLTGVLRKRRAGRTVQHSIRSEVLGELSTAAELIGL